MAMSPVVAKGNTDIMRFNVEQIVAATGGFLVQREASSFDAYGIDSRTIAKNGLFFALAGSQTDGHRFVKDAWDHGAAGAVLEKRVEEIPITLIQVENSMKALHKLAWFARQSSKAKFIGITGSSGKTSTKEYTANLLSEKFNVFRSAGNLNSKTGLPLSLLSMYHEECAVFEIGMNQPGEISSLTHLLKPEIAVLLNVNPVHLGQFPSVDAIADEKVAILKSVASDTPIVYNEDDPRIVERTRNMRNPKISFGFSPKADLQITNDRLKGIEGMDAAFRWKGELKWFRTRLSGMGNLYNIAAATGAALLCGLDWNQIQQGIAKLQPFEHRGVLYHLGGIHIYDDAYNSNPKAAEFALGILAQSEGYSRKVAILGDMLELGSDEQEFHSKVGEQVAASGIKVLITAGHLSKYTAAAARNAGVRIVYDAANAAEAAEIAVNTLTAGDLVLVKGSRGMKMENVIDRLRQHTSSRAAE
jgi:UDP-N-acetylmuramoyl-tripeptide--D-alanyl-D-alanine ligase